MDVFDVRDRLIDDYRDFTTSFADPRDPRIKQHVSDQLDRGDQWPEPWLSLNPSFESGGAVEELVEADLLHPECSRIFRVKRDVGDAGARSLTFHKHQRDAIEVARSGKSYVLTTGTGSGKSLAYIVPIVDRVLRRPAKPGVKAIVVYPMNALANSQRGELEKFLTYGYGEGKEPVTFARYTGQERGEERERILRNPPDILLTNYVMLELVLTRPEERKHLVTAASGLEFLVLDELHTYRGRQGADVAMLVRRVRDACQAPSLQCIGTSATMASTGTAAQQRVEVAAVATRLFGSEVTPERVIGETLSRATPEHYDDGALAETVRAQSAPTSYDNLKDSPLASWIESTFGLVAEEESGRLIRQRPRKVRDEAAPRLAGLTGLTVDTCEQAIRQTLLTGANVQHPQTGRPLFAFRLHQFLSKGDSVYVTLESEQDRVITSTYQVAAPKQPDKLLFPLAFCRECGQEYINVSKLDASGKTRLLPRRDSDVSGGDSSAGYLFISSDTPWPEAAEIESRLPDSWIDGGEVLANRHKYLPQRLWVDAGGNKVGNEDEGTRAAFVPSPFMFCLRCGVSFESTRGNDYSKLATLDREGRSSAVSIISESIVRSLRHSDLPDDARKLLTFVDNRQDASLQAGHINDFVQVIQLRGALYRAAQDAPGGLTHENVAQTTAEMLGLDFADYAASPDAKYQARDDTERAFRNMVEYRIYSDIQPGRRITLPNLEQTGLLKVGYASLEQIAADQDVWDDVHHTLGSADSGIRFELCRIVLDELRRALAIDVDCLTEEGFELLRRQSGQHLTGQWRLSMREKPPEVGIAFPRPAGRRRRSVDTLFLSGRSSLGTYLRKPGRFGRGAGTVSVDDSQEIIVDILRVLATVGVLTVAVPEDDGGPGYRIKASALLWNAGDGTQGAPDPLRKTVDADVGIAVNRFFLSLYRDHAAEFSHLTAAEHTAQVSQRDREDREERFREGTLPLLYCSPTMELGVDIAQLNAVGLRNVPPTPANYAQRSGRAGRSGQPALVVTYCATGNSHDQYYFRRSNEMVAGSVVAPRLDLANEALVRSHLHALWLAETHVSLESRMTQLLDTDGEDPTLAIRYDTASGLADSDAVNRAVARAADLLAPLETELRTASWWHEEWGHQVIASAYEAFERACDRWRSLYRAALADQSEQNKLVVQTNLSGFERRAAEARRREAENQLRLLKNEDDERGHSDFYTYRYFASEGFLPGYSFPRLPLAAYIPAVRQRTDKMDGGDYLQRPRFLAISEFGPRALIYHEGARYEVTRVQIPMAQGEGVGSIDVQEARRCESCGYHHERRPGLDVCENCGAELGPPVPGLMRMQTVFTRRRERISSDEEERRRAGFEIETSYQFAGHGTHRGRLDADVVNGDGDVIATLSYGDTAQVRRTNLGLRRRKDASDRGYWLNTVDGKWLSERAAADAIASDDDLDDAAQVNTKQKVIPFVEDTRNVLILRLTRRVSEEIEATLRAALERGIEAAFQLEDSELMGEVLPDRDERGRMLFSESAEGGAGVLRRLQAEPDAVAIAARKALEIAHFDPQTGDDVQRAPGQQDPCERACYDCLLSYANQLEHSLIDRHQVRDLLMELAAATTVPAESDADTDDLLTRLRDACDADSPEWAFLDLLAAGDHVLPTGVRQRIDATGTRPDFLFHRDGPVAVFMDGPERDGADPGERDADAEERLLDAGWSVMRFAHDDDWSQVIAERPDIFGKGRG